MADDVHSDRRDGTGRHGLDVRFLGCGLAPWQRAGSPCAWFEDGDNLVLVGCGPQVPRVLSELPEYGRAKSLTVALPSNAPIMSGGLSSLAVMAETSGRRLRVLTADGLQERNVRRLMSASGVPAASYEMVPTDDMDRGRFHDPLLHAYYNRPVVEFNRSVRWFDVEFDRPEFMTYFVAADAEPSAAAATVAGLMGRMAPEHVDAVYAPAPGDGESTVAAFDAALDGDARWRHAIVFSAFGSRAAVDEVRAHGYRVARPGRRGSGRDRGLQDVDWRS